MAAINLSRLKLLLPGVMNSFILLLPGGVTSLGLFLLASGRLNPLAPQAQPQLLILLQLQALGVTFAKFGIDQIIFSRLQKEDYLATGKFYFQRVLPLTLLYSIVIFILYRSYELPLLFIGTLPLEVYSIITVMEHNVARRFVRTCFIMLMGYPLIFTFIIMCFLFQVDLNFKLIPAFFLISSLVKFGVSVWLRVTKNKVEAADYSIQIPVQQVTNFWMFRSDQLLIGGRMYSQNMWQNFELSSYLFFAKLPEISSSILIYLAPLLYKKLEQKDNSFSLLRLLGSRLFLFINLMIILLFLFAFQFFFIGDKTSGILYLLPFVVQGMLILPINLITYLRFRSVKIRQHNIQSILAILPGLGVAALAIKTANPFLLSWSVPVQLAVFLFIYHFRSDKSEETASC